MWIVITFSIIAVVLSYLDSMGIMRNGMKLGFLLVIALLALHYNYGNDYMEYYREYLNIANYSFSSAMSGESASHGESGWQILNYLFSRISEPYGFFILVATIAIFQNIVVYRLVKKYVYKKYWALSVFIYLFTTNLYLLSFSMMRQSFVVWIFLALWPHIKRRNWLFSLLVLFLCSFIHSSALILIPFAFMGFWQVKNGKAIAVVWLILFIALSFSSSLISKFVAIGANVDVFNAFIATYQESGIQVGSGIGLSSVPFFISLYFLFSQKSNNTAINQLVIISTFSFIFGTISHVIPLASRLSIYFDAYNILSFPLIFNALKRPFRPFFIILFCLGNIYLYSIFFQSESVYYMPYLEYQTIISVL